MANRMQLRTKLLIGFIVVAMIGSVIGIFGIINLRTLDAADTFLYEKSTVPLGYLIHIAVPIQRARVNLHKMFIAATKAEIEADQEKITAYFKEADDNLNLYTKTFINKDDEIAYNEFIDKFKTYKNVSTQIHELLLNNKKEEAKNILDTTGLNASNAMNDVVDKVVNLNVGNAKNLSESNTALTNSSTFIMIIVILIGLAVSIFLAIWLGVFMISRPLMKISETLSSGSTQISIASNQLSSSSQEIANGATEQASSIEETTSSMEELSSMVKQNVGNAKEASTLADKASDASQTGFGQMEKMLESMNDINKSSDQIKKIIKVIDDIAFQTNILALNAAVEAARAGEAGMGFAVVADEVKNLANRSAAAAKETSGMIEESINKINGGLAIATKLADVFKDILVNAKKVSEMAREVEAASRQQDSGINQVNKAIINFDEVVQANASAAEETASSAEELLGQVESLNDIVSSLILLVTGKETEMTHKTKQAVRLDKTANNSHIARLAETGKKHDLATTNKQGVQTKRKKEVSPEKVIPFEEDEDFTVIG